VLKRFFGKSVGAARPKSSASSALTKIDLDRVKTLIDFFPIGKKLRYYPEFKQEIVFDTLVLAYCVNGNFVYSGEAIERDSEGYPTLFHSGESGQRTHFSALSRFQLLVPDTSDLEMKLDYDRWALIGRGRQFNIGNCISLISHSGGRGVSTVDTEVAKHVELADGPYANTTMILLTPDLHTLSVTDQRKKSRTKLSAPVTLSLVEGAFSGPCTIVDISEGDLRLRMRERGAAMPPMQRGDEVVIETELGAAERRYLIKATVIRRSAETCVIHMEGQFKDGKFLSLRLLDLLELKAGLINYGR
jgi:hypothetical protein